VYFSGNVEKLLLVIKAFREAISLDQSAVNGPFVSGSGTLYFKLQYRSFGGDDPILSTYLY
jgi:hypothetical protein